VRLELSAWRPSSRYWLPFLLLARRPRSAAISYSMPVRAWKRTCVAQRVGFSLFANSAQVYLEVKGHNASLQYATSGDASKRRIEARFGGLGRVSMRFRPTASPHLVPEPDGNCKGKGELVQPGIFVGTFEFEGEQGYTAAHATRIRGTTTHKMKQICKNDGGEEGRPTSIRWTLLHAQAADGEISVVAFATEFASHPAFDGSVFSARLIEFHRRGMSIFRTIESDANLNALNAMPSSPMER
jgi:hypothetical protein